MLPTHDICCSLAQLGIKITRWHRPRQAKVATVLHPGETMIALYTLFVSFLNTIQFVLYRRAKSLEHKFTRVALTAKKMAGKIDLRRGNSNGSDPYKSARQQFELGRLVHQRDRLEDKHFAWQNRYEKVCNFTKALTRWKGRALPYVFGFVDVSLLLFAVHCFGWGTIDLSPLAEQFGRVLNG